MSTLSLILCGVGGFGGGTLIASGHSRKDSYDIVVGIIWLATLVITFVLGAFA